MKSITSSFRSLKRAIGAMSLCLLFLTSIAQNTSSHPNKLTIEEKLFGLSKFWSEVKYNFVYLNQIGSQICSTAFNGI